LITRLRPAKDHEGRLTEITEQDEKADAGLLDQSAGIDLDHVRSTGADRPRNHEDHFLHRLHCGRLRLSLPGFDTFMSRTAEDRASKKSPRDFHRAGFFCQYPTIDQVGVPPRVST
jgi:hypothetical protein